MGWFQELFTPAGPCILWEGTRFTPEKFGMAAAMWSADSSQAVVKSILEAGKERPGADTVYTRAGANLRVTQLPIIPLHIATYGFALLQLPGVSLEIVQDFRKGIVSAVKSGPVDGAHEVLLSLLSQYGTFLQQETTDAADDSLESSPAATAACDFICKGLSELRAYGEKPPLQIDPMDRTLITLIIATSIAAQFRAIEQVNPRIAVS